MIFRHRTLLITHNDLIMNFISRSAVNTSPDLLGSGIMTLVSPFNDVIVLIVHCFDPLESSITRHLILYPLSSSLNKDNVNKLAVDANLVDWNISYLEEFHSRLIG